MDHEILKMLCYCCFWDAKQVSWTSPHVFCLTGDKSSKAWIKKNFPSLWLYCDSSRHGWTQRSHESVWQSELLDLDLEFWNLLLPI